MPCSHHLSILHACVQCLLEPEFEMSVTSLLSAVPSQVVLGRTLGKKQMLMSVCTKIAIQLNCKLGGEVWAVEMPVS